MLLRLVMATAQRSVRQTRSKTGLGKDPLPSVSTTNRPKSLSDASVTGQTSTRKTVSSSSASNVNPRRNVRQRKPIATSQSDTTLNKHFQNLSISDKRKPGSRATSSNAVPIRKSSSAGSGSCKTLEDVARLILRKRCKNIVVMAGAGISTPSGIPDFRTPGSGLYDNLQQYKIPYPEAIFDIDFFQKDPRPFFTLAKELYPGGQYKPNYVHYFCRMLHEKGILLRMYTQNIDGLERLAGIPAAKLVEAHGTFLKASCTRCGHPHDEEQIKNLIFSDKIPSCSLRGCTGKVKPDIVFFGEDLPKRFFYYLKDFPQCDLVIIMGTSLEVYPFAGIVDSARGYVPRLLINRDLVGPFKKRPGSSSRGRFNDLGITGDLVECVQRFARVLGWKKAMEDLIKEHEALLDTQSRQILKASNGQLTNGITAGESPDSKPANGRSESSVGGTTNANGKMIDKQLPCDTGRQSAPVGSPSRNGSTNGTRNYHTVSEKTVGLQSSRSLPISNSPSRTGRVALPKISNERNGNSWAVKVGRYRTQRRQSTSSSSSSTESSSEDSSSDES